MSLPHVPELLVILFIILVIFGAGRLPEVAGALGKSIREFRRGSQEEDEKPSATTSKAEDKESQGA